MACRDVAVFPYLSSKRAVKDSAVQPAREAALERHRLAANELPEASSVKRTTIYSYALPLLNGPRDALALLAELYGLWELRRR
jgi:hypothetical protein